MTQDDWQRIQDSFSDRLTPFQRLTALRWYLIEAIAIAKHRFKSAPLSLTHERTEDRGAIC